MLLYIIFFNALCFVCIKIKVLYISVQRASGNQIIAVTQT